MVAPIRLTPQTQQARRSIRQIADCLEAFGWVVTPPSEDLGEDLIAHIYFDGRATGVFFHIQSKSITNLNQRKRKDFLPYRFKVKDLNHWSAFALPVVLLVWDINQKEGCWLPVKEAIFQLEKRNPRWRTQKTATIHIPWSNTTDNAGLKHLRQAIGHQLAPQLTHGKALEGNLVLKFPNDPQGGEALEQFKAYLQEGQSVTLTENLISKIELSAWFHTWFGEPTTITLGPNINKSPMSLKLDLLSSEKPIPPQYIEGIIQSGQEIITISNYHQLSHPLHLKISFSINKANTSQVSGKQIQFTRNYLGCYVEETIQTEAFIQALCQGGQLLISSPNHHDFRIQLDVELEQPLVQIDPQFSALIQKLYEIQKWFNRPLQLPAKGFSLVDDKDIAGLWNIIKTGKTKTFPEYLTLTVDPGAADFDLFLHLYKEQESQNNTFTITRSGSESRYEILGETIETGALIQHAHCKAQLTYQELLKKLSQHPSGELLALKFTDVVITDIYPDFYLLEAQRLAALIQAKYAVGTIYLFGSLALNQGFTPETDIDLAIDGVSDQDFIDLLDYLEQETLFAMNIVELEYTPSALRKRILEEGVKLYESQSIAIGK